MVFLFSRKSKKNVQSSHYGEPYSLQVRNGWEIEKLFLKKLANTKKSNTLHVRSIV
jgi:hypothetical protein